MLKKLFSGRINRMTYFIGHLLWTGIVIGSIVFISVLFAIFRMITTFLGVDTTYSSAIPIAQAQQTQYEYQNTLPDESPAFEPSPEPTYGFTSVGDLFVGLANLGFFFLLIAVLFVVPFVGGLSLTIRRLHDIGQSGWMVLLFLVPVLNIFFSLVPLFVPGEAKQNKWGKPPKEGMPTIRETLGV